MNEMRMRIAVLAAVVSLASPMLVAQMDPTNSNPTPMNPQSPQNTNMPLNQSGNPNQTGSQATPQTMRDTLGAPGQTGQEMIDTAFLRNATQGGIGEVKLGTLATQKGGTEIKTFGQKMVDDHTTINKDLASVSDDLGVMLPKKMNKDDQAEYDKLKGLSGDDFDKEYILYMAKDHRADFRAFRMEATSAADPELQSQTAKDLLVIRDHLMMLSKLATEKGVTLPPRPQRPEGAPPPPAK